MPIRLARYVFIGAVVWIGFAAIGRAQAIDSDVKAPVDAPRPAALLPLYGTLAGVQALDLDSTLKALRSGAYREANPLLQSASQSPAVLLAFKAGATASMIVASERLRKHHPKLAVALMAGINSAYAIIAIHNYSLSQRKP